MLSQGHAFGSSSRGNNYGRMEQQNQQFDCLDQGGYYSAPPVHYSTNNQASSYNASSIHQQSFDSNQSQTQNMSMPSSALPNRSGDSNFGNVGMDTYFSYSSYGNDSSSVQNAAGNFNQSMQGNFQKESLVGSDYGYGSLSSSFVREGEGEKKSGNDSSSNVMMDYSTQYNQGYAGGSMTNTMNQFQSNPQHQTQFVPGSVEQKKDTVSFQRGRGSGVSVSGTGRQFQRGRGQRGRGGAGFASSSDWSKPDEHTVYLSAANFNMWGFLRKGFNKSDDNLAEHLFEIHEKLCHRCQDRYAERNSSKRKRYCSEESEVAGKEEEIPDEELTEEELEMKKLMGFAGFKSTKGSKFKASGNSAGNAYGSGQVLDATTTLTDAEKKMIASKGGFSVFSQAAQEHVPFGAPAITMGSMPPASAHTE